MFQNIYAIHVSSEIIIIVYSMSLVNARLPDYSYDERNCGKLNWGKLAEIRAPSIMISTRLHR